MDKPTLLRGSGFSTSRIALYSLLAAIAFCILGERAEAEGRTVNVPANAEWVDTGIDVQSGIAFLLTIQATGAWTNSSGGTSVGAAGYGSLRLPESMAPTLPFASLIGRVNESVFEIGDNFRGKSPASGRLFLSMNDVSGTFGDNAGELIVVVDQPANPAVTTFEDPVLFLDLLSADPQPYFQRPSFRWTLRNKLRPQFSSQLVIFVDGVQGATYPAAQLVTDLSPGSERTGTFDLFTGVDPVLPPGDHTIRLEAWALTPSHEVLASATTSVTSFVPSPPPSISILEFKSTPDYQDQGKDVELNWKLQATTYCIPTDLVIMKKDYGSPDMMVLQEGMPSTTGSKTEAVKGNSSPLTYTLSVGCKVTPAGQKLAGTTVAKDVKVSFGPKPPPATPYVVSNGPFISPSFILEKHAFSVSWTFWNAGGAKSSEFDVQLYIDGAKEGDAKTVPAFDSGASKNMDWTITKELSVGSHALELKQVSNGGSISYFPFDVLPAP